MKPQNQKLSELLELINNYPSPHNGQPMRLRAKSETVFEILFDTSRGLTATPISYLFSFVTIGVFVRHLELSAEALGHEATVSLHLPKQGDMGQGGQLHCADVTIRFDTIPPQSDLVEAIKNRQTSRKKYTSGLTSEEQDKINEIARQHGIANRFLNPAQAHQTIWLNQRAVFDDMFDDKVRAELDHWLRYSEEEKHAKQDGLAYDCMELSGGALKTVMKHYKILHWPVLSSVLQSYYLRTMKDHSSVGYFASRFETEQQSYEIGRCIIEVWLQLTKTGKYIHPFGTIVSNDKAHADFTKIVGLTDEDRASNYVVFIYRAGTSPKPVESDRIPVAKHLLMEERA